MSDNYLLGHFLVSHANDVAGKIHEFDQFGGVRLRAEHDVGRLMQDMHEISELFGCDLEECRQHYLARLPEIEEANERRRRILEAAE